MKKLLDLSATVLRFTLIMALLVMLASLCYQVFTRYVLGRAAAWSEEVAVLMFAWLILGGLSLGIREGYHVAFTALPDILSGWTKRLWGLAMNALTLSIGAYLLWSGLRFYDFTTGTTSAAIGYPTELLNGMVPVSALLICIYSAENGFNEIAGCKLQKSGIELAS